MPQTYRARCVTLVSAMGESSSSGLTHMLDAIGKCSGRSGFRDWKINLSQAINFHTQELLTVLEGGERPTATAANAEAVAAWDKANTVACFPSFSSRPPGLRSSPSVLKRGRRPTPGGTEGRPGKLSTRVSTLKYRKLGVRVTTSSSNLRQLQGGDPIDFFTNGWDLRLRLKGLG